MPFCQWTLIRNQWNVNRHDWPFSIQCMLICNLFLMKSKTVSSTLARGRGIATESCNRTVICLPFLNRFRNGTRIGIKTDRIGYDFLDRFRICVCAGSCIPIRQNSTVVYLHTVGLPNSVCGRIHDRRRSCNYDCLRIPDRTFSF